MQPFVKKLTGVEPESESRSTGSQTETVAEPLRRVNTSILTTNKLIYIEAIAVLYARNPLHFDAQMCAHEDIVSPHATDLSLATNVIVKIDDSLDPRAAHRVGKALKSLSPPSQLYSPTCEHAACMSPWTQTSIPCRLCSLSTILCVVRTFSLKSTLTVWVR
jgi:hypothetical protein